MNRRDFLGKLAQLPFVAILFPAWREKMESHQGLAVTLDNAILAPGGNTAEGNTLVLGDYTTLTNCKIYADKVIMGKCSTILDCEVAGGIELLT